MPKLNLLRLLALVIVVLGTAGALWLALTREVPQANVWVWKRALPAYHQIHPDRDLKKEKYATKGLSQNILRVNDEVAGRYTLSKVTAENQLKEDELGPTVKENIMADAVVLGIDATYGTILGGRLAAGDLIDLRLVSMNRANQASEPICFGNVLVLEVKPASSAKGQFALVVALPMDEVDGLAQANMETRWLVTRSTGNGDTTVHSAQEDTTENAMEESNENCSSETDNATRPDDTAGTSDNPKVDVTVKIHNSPEVRQVLPDSGGE